MAVPAPPSGNRFVAVTPNDNAAPLAIVAILSAVFALLTFAIRIFIVKWKRHGHDDTLLGLAHIIALGHWISIFIALQHGLGKTLDIVKVSDHSVLAKATFLGRILLMPALCLTKISVLIVLRHLFSYESRRKLLLIDGTMVMVILWGFASTIALSAGCSPNYLLGDGTCPYLSGRIKGVMVTEIITEALVFGLCPFFLYSFDIALKTKMMVVAAFCFRIPLLPLSALYLVTQTNYLASLSTPNGTTANTLNSVTTNLFQEILISYALISATIPCMKSFVEGFTTGGVSYVTDPNAGRIPTKTTFGSGRSAESEESYELAGVGGTGMVAQPDVDENGRDKVVEVRQDGGRRISARLSRVWNGPQQSIDSQGSTAQMIRKRNEVDEAGDVALLDEAV